MSRDSYQSSFVALSILLCVCITIHKMFTMSGMPHAPSLPSFNPDEDPTWNGQQWDKWLKRFDNYLVAANITSDAWKKAYMR